MQSAAIQVESLALIASGQPSTPLSANPSSSSKPSLQPPVAPPQGQYSTNAAVWDNGKITLKGNPFKLQKENFCPSCKLPRLMFPLTGVGAKIPEDVNRQYCTLHPFIQKQGHDIYGNPFPVDAGKTKKEREALRKLERQEKDNTPGSADTGTADSEWATGDPSIRKLMAGGKGATYVPWHTCPNCKRSLLITKFAQHLEKCMGIGGRTSRNAAVARISSINGNGNGSQQGSRTGTPAPSQGSNSKRDAEPDSDKEDGPPKKKAKKDKKDKKDKEPKVMLKFKATSKVDSSKRPPKSSSDSVRDKSRSDRDSSQKRDREGSAADDLPKKKMKVGKDSSSTLPEITAGSD
jgi:ribonuclease P/MRP protein subunit POP1